MKRVGKLHKRRICIRSSDSPQQCKFRARIHENSLHVPHCADGGFNGNPPVRQLARFSIDKAVRRHLPRDGREGGVVEDFLCVEACAAVRALVAHCGLCECGAVRTPLAVGFAGAECDGLVVHPWTAHRTGQHFVRGQLQAGLVADGGLDPLVEVGRGAVDAWGVRGRVVMHCARHSIDAGILANTPSRRELLFIAWPARVDPAVSKEVEVERTDSTPAGTFVAIAHFAREALMGTIVCACDFQEIYCRTQRLAALGVVHFICNNDLGGTALQWQRYCRPGVIHRRVIIIHSIPIDIDDEHSVPDVIEDLRAFLVSGCEVSAADEVDEGDQIRLQPLVQVRRSARHHVPAALVRGPRGTVSAGLPLQVGRRVTVGGKRRVQRLPVAFRTGDPHAATYAVCSAGTQRARCLPRNHIDVQVVPRFADHCAVKPCGRLRNRVSTSVLPVEVSSALSLHTLRKLAAECRGTAHGGNHGQQ